MLSYSRRRAPGYAAAFLLISTFPAYSQTDTFTVSADVVSSCTITANDLDFGNYDPTSLTDVTGTTTIVANCTIGTDYNIALDLDGAADAESREMAGPGVDTLTYGLYQDVTLLVPWGEGGDVLNTPVLTVGTGANQTHTVYGSITAGQGIQIGSYSDTVTATLSY